MSLDARVKDALERSSKIVHPDVRRDLVAVRRKARRAVILRRVTNAMVAALLVSTAVFLAPRVLDAITERGSSAHRPNTTGGANLGHPIVGSWTQMQSCQDFVRAFAEHGLSHYVPQYLMVNGYRDQPKSEIAADPHPCKGAGPALKRTWVFDGTVLLGFLGDLKVDEALPEVIDDHTIRISHINLGIQINDDLLRFIVPQVPASCVGPDCLSQHAWAVAAFGLGPWHRVA